MCHYEEEQEKTAQLGRTDSITYIVTVSCFLMADDGVKVQLSDIPINHFDNNRRNFIKLLQVKHRRLRQKFR